MVDAFAQIDQQQLSYLAHNQKKLRAELYTGLVDTVQSGDIDLGSIGQCVILPSLYIGGTRHTLILLLEFVMGPELF